MNQIEYDGPYVIVWAHRALFSVASRRSPPRCALWRHRGGTPISRPSWPGII